MSDDQTLESYEKFSITAEKMRRVADSIDVPTKLDGRLLSQHRHVLTD